MLLDLNEIFNLLEDYVIIKMNSYFPKYKINEDVDILTINLKKNINIILDNYDKNNFVLKITQIKNNNHYHIDFYQKTIVNQLHFRIDIFNELNYLKFDVDNSVVNYIIDNKINYIVDQVSLFVPKFEDELSLRYMEYMEYKDVRKDKIKHLDYVKKFDCIKFNMVNKNQKNYKLNYENIESRYDVMIVWGHGISHIIEILNQINQLMNCDILMIKRDKINDIDNFIKKIYALEMINTEHINQKTNYLKKNKREYIAILIKNNYSKKIKYGEGKFCIESCENIVNTKWKIRELFNPKSFDPKSQISKNLPPGISHEHVIHASDNSNETCYLCNMIFENPPDYYNKKVINNIFFPWHTSDIKNHEIVIKDIDILKVRLVGEKILLTISDSLVYNYVCGKKDKYIEYIKKYIGNQLTDDHCPYKFDMLIKNFNPHNYNYEEERLIIIDNNNIILDGHHRLSILKKNNIHMIKVVKVLL